MTYLLDTNACIAIINGNPLRVRERFDAAMAARDTVSIPSIVSYELWYGAAKSQRPAFNARRLRVFFADALQLMPFEDEDAQAAGDLRATLERAGTPIGPYDVLIAGMAKRRALTLVTANTREFRRVRGLVWEDWSKA